MKMDFYVSSETLNCLEEIIYESNLELLKKVHKKFLSKLDFEELLNILNGVKKKFKIKINDNGK